MRIAATTTPAQRPAADLAAEFAPIIHGRQSTSGTDDWPRTDRPLRTAVNVERRDDGSVRLDYCVLFANEDGGTATDDLMRNWGRTTDYERLYTIVLDSTGRVVPGSEQFQGPRHKWTSFQGPRDGARAVLHVSTRNNMVSAGRGGSEVVIDTTSPIIAERTPGEPLLDSLDVMRLTPESWHAMAQEVRREHKVRAESDPLADDDRILDPQRYVYVANVPRSGAALTLTVADGSEITLPLPARDIGNDQSMAVPLPGRLRGADIRSVEAPGAERGAWLLRSATVLGSDDSPVEFDPRP